jgi:hypothetical protein
VALSFLKKRLFLGFVLLAAGVVFFLIGFNIEKDMWSSKNWPTVQGKITKSEFSYRKRHYTPEIKYNYSVNGKEFTSEKIALGIKDSETSISKVYSKSLERFPKDKIVNVYYAPANPENAVLEPGINNGNFLYYVLSIVSALSGIFLITNYFTGFGDSFIETYFS